MHLPQFCHGASAAVGGGSIGKVGIFVRPQPAIRMLMLRTARWFLPRPVPDGLARSRYR